MSESVEQAALRAALPAPFGSILGAMEAAERLNEARYRHLQDVYEELAELRDEVHALSLALVRAGIPLREPPPLRGVS